MKDFKAIIQAYHKVDFSIRKAALATVVKVSGSSYRSPGARMLITDDGRWTGSISGGCLEGDALRKARKVMMDKQAMTITYDTREESNQQLGIGLGCNGVIDVLIEPIDPNDSLNPISLYETFINTKVPVALATVFASQKSIGEKALITHNGFIIKDFTSHGLNELVLPELSNVFETKKSAALHFQFQNEEIDVFVELIQPPITLIMFGAGFDARPVCEMAKTLGWDVVVTDECISHIAPIFFPEADQLKLCDRKFVDRDFEITPYTACVLMSHNYEYDRDVLKKLLKTEAPYIGILGPKKRLDKMEIEFQNQGISFSEDDLERIHAPIGLDIGAETPDEIAISIIAEIQTKFSNRSGGFLKNRNKPIHDRDSKSDQVFKQVYLHSISKSN